MSASHTTSDLAGVLVAQRARVREIADVLARYGFAQLAIRTLTVDKTASGPLAHLAAKQVSPEVANLTRGERLRGALTELGTAWIKLGQMLSVRPDIVGNDVANELSGLQVSVPADPPSYAEQMLEAQLGRPAAELFATFNSAAMASGSVAQVHQAELHDGTPVAVKILHEGIERTLLSDLELMRALAASVESLDEELARYRPTQLVSEFDATMRSALDLGKERRSLQRFTTNFEAEPDVVIPTPYSELSTSKILTMQLMQGDQLSRDAALALGWDVEELIRRAGRIYLDMIFRDGVYHADPHPGNFLLREDKEIVILDFGDIGYVSAKRRKQITELLVAMEARDLAGVTSQIATITDAPGDTDLDALSQDVELWMNDYLSDDLSDLDVAGMLSSSMQLMHRHALSLPADLATLARVLMLLQGMAAGIGSTTSVGELIEPYIVELLRQRLKPGAIGGRFAEQLRGWASFVESGPRDLRSFLAAARDGELGIDVRFRDPDGKVDYLVDGLIVSALVVASGQLTARQAGPLVRSISVPGMLTAGLGAFAYKQMRNRQLARDKKADRRKKTITGIARSKR